MAKLVVTEGRNVGWEYKIPSDKTRVVMGRRSANEVPVADPKSSRDHAEVLCHGGRFVLRDLKSRNGTFLNTNRVMADEELEFGDKIRIGDTVYEIIDDAAGEPISIQIPGYEILQRIGQGGMGTVYKARQLSMDRIVALKVLNERYSNDEQFTQRFIREARAAGKLSHPNVIHVHDVSQSGEIHYFSMEFVDGISVKRLIKKQGKIEFEKAADIILQAARALDYAHQNNIIHRDIKPDNLMLTTDGVVKLADLGIAKTFDESSSGISAKQRRVYGTPHYMAPEQALGKEMDARADIYSLGATFYHMLTGATPFKGDTVTDVLKAHIQSNLPAVQEKAPEVPDNYVFIVERMMAKSVEKRYASMSKLIEDLEKAKSDREAEIERLSAGESSILPAAKRKKRREEAGARRELPAWAKALVAVGVLVGLAVLFFVTVSVAKTFLEPAETPASLWRKVHDHRTAGRMDEARHVSDQIVEQFPSSVEAGYAKTFLASLDEPSLETPPEEEKPEESLARVEELEKAGELEKAHEAAIRFAERFPAEGELIARAEKVADRIRDALKARRETDAAQALADGDRYASENPDDLAGQARRYKAVADGFGDTAAGVAAQTKTADLMKRMAAAKAEAASRDFRDARGRADSARSKGDYDAALQAYRTFVAQHDGSREAGEARATIAKLEKEVEAAFADAQATADKYFTNGSYGEARAALQRFTTSYISGRWKGQADRALADIDRRIEGLYQKDGQKAHAQSLAFAHEDAASQYRVLSARYSGTRWAELAKSRSTEIEAQRKLHAELIRRVGEEAAAASRDLPFAPPGIPESMAGMKWHIQGATERGLTLAAGRNNEFQRPVIWGSLPPDKLMDLYDLYFPKPTVEERLALSHFCRERGLDARAQTYLEGATGN